MTRPTVAAATVGPRRLPRRTAVRSVRTGVVGIAARLLGFDALAARRNAWEAVCVNRERRRQWEEAI